MKLAEILQKLQEPLPKTAISTKTIKGQNIPYVAWYDLAALLDERASGWEWKVESVQVVANHLVLVGSLTIHATDGSRTMHATGCEEHTADWNRQYGDPSSNAEAMAFRRAAAKFGLARELSRKSKSAIQPRKGELSREQWMAKYGDKILN